MLFLSTLGYFFNFFDIEAAIFLDMLAAEAAIANALELSPKDSQSISLMIGYEYYSDGEIVFNESQLLAIEEKAD